jgi:colanic acid/amylovoran biosynthesis glycosyltransferase
MNDAERLVVLPSLKAVLRPDGRVTVTQKFVDGMTEYARYWDGPVSAIVEPATEAGDNLDNVLVVPAELPFGLEVISFDDRAIVSRIGAAAAALGGTDHRQNRFAELCRKLAVAYVMNTEYTLETRKQIAAAEERNPLRRWRRYGWEAGQERENVRNLRLAAGVQCNGLPTFEAYQGLNPAAHLYFDTRVTLDMLPSEACLERRLSTMLAGEPLRIVFSGRLIPMKGADHLPRFAHELRRRGVPFHLTICGAGNLEESIRLQMQKLDLCGKIGLTGTLDFKTQLLERVKEETDLFVCPHRQGDPSCTYLETLACGVPIVGYDNEAWRGLEQLSQGGRTVELDDYEGLADAVMQLHHDRDELCRMSLRAWEFGKQHTFERTFEERIAHLRRCAGLEEAVKV